MRKILWSFLIIAIAYTVLYLLKYKANDLALFLIKAIFISGFLALLFATIRKLLIKSDKSFFHFFSTGFLYVSVMYSVIEPVSYLSVRSYFFGNPLSTSKEFNKEDSTREIIATLPDAVKEMNKLCPRVIDSITEITKATLQITDTTVIYFYKITAYSKEDFNDLEQAKNSVKDMVSEAFYKDPELLRLNRHKVNVIFRYSDMNNIFLFDVLFNASGSIIVN